MPINFNPKIKILYSYDEIIQFTSVLILFLQGFVIRNFYNGIDLKLYYFLLLFNFVFIAIKYGVKLHKYLIIFLLFITVHGFLMYSIYGTPYRLLIKQLLGVSMVSIFFYNVFINYDKFKLFQIYLKLALTCCIIALIMYPSGLLDKDPSRLDGLMTEPSTFIMVNVPALFYCLKKKKFLSAFIFLLGFYFAQSSLGYLALIVMLVFLIIKKETIFYLLYAILVIIFIAPFFIKSEKFQDRYKSTKENLEVFETRKFTRFINVSTFALLKNAYISYNNFKDHPLGTGIGSFAYWHDYYLDQLTLPNHIQVTKLSNLNREDGNSLFIRALSDFGLFTLFIILIFLYIVYNVQFKKYDSEMKIICLAMIINIFVKLLRLGHYFTEDTFFFLYMFMFTLPKFGITNKKLVLK